MTERPYVLVVGATHNEALVHARKLPAEENAHPVSVGDNVRGMRPSRVEFAPGWHRNPRGEDAAKRADWWTDQMLPILARPQ